MGSIFNYEVNVKIFISGKCSDMTTLNVVDDEGNTISPYRIEGYVPPAFGGGDYIDIGVDVDTGVIVGWPGKDVVLQTLLDHKSGQY